MTYLPTTDTGIRNWAKNLFDQLSALADPMSVGISAQQLADYGALYAEYNTKYEIASKPGTRGGATILAKNIAKDALMTHSRQLAMTITHHPGVTNQQRYAFGLTVTDTEQARNTISKTPPDLSILSTSARSLKVRLKDQDNPERRGKPSGTQGATVLYYAGDAAPENPSEWMFGTIVSKSLFTLDIPATVPAGSKVFVTAFWFNARKEMSSAATPRSTRIGEGLALAA